MNLNEMKLGVRYIVTKGSDCGTFQLGDHVLLLKTGDIICTEAAGWVEAENLKAVHGTEVEVDQRWVERKREKLKAELERMSA